MRIEEFFNGSFTVTGLQERGWVGHLPHGCMSPPPVVLAIGHPLLYIREHKFTVTHQEDTVWAQ